MSECSERLEQTRLAILEQVRVDQEKPGMLRSAMNRAARLTGLDREPPSDREVLRPLGQTMEDDAAAMRASAAARVSALPADPAERHERRATRLFSPAFAGLGEAGRAYWHNHPARLVLELATPALSSLAQRQPLGYLAGAAALGAVAFAARPWRLISVTGLAVAALRSPAVATALISALYGNSQTLNEPPE